MAGRKTRRKLKLNTNKSEQEIWSDLPKDLLLSILSRLNLKETTCASAVCKSWFLVVNSERVLNKSPLLVRIPSSGDSFELYNPATRKTSYTKLPQLRGCWIFEHSIDGWLLVSQLIIQRVFFFNLYNQDSIDLPRFKLYGHKVALTSSPVSNDCTVFAVNISTTVVSISRCNLKTMKWITNDYPSPEAELSQSWIIVSNGILYFKSQNGWLRTFDTQTCKWTLDVVPRPRLPCLPGVHKWIRYWATHRENIFYIYLCCVKEPMIFKLNQTNGKWEEINTLGGVIFFVGTGSVQARVHLLGMKANNIYFPNVRFYGQQCIRYSVDEGRYYPNKKYSLPEKLHPLRSFWIDPPTLLM